MSEVNISNTVREVINDAINEMELNFANELRGIAKKQPPAWVYVTYGLGIGMMLMLPGIGIWCAIASLIGGIHYKRKVITIISAIVILISAANSFVGWYWVINGYLPWASEPGYIYQDTNIQVIGEASPVEENAQEISEPSEDVQVR